MKTNLNLPLATATIFSLALLSTACSEVSPIKTSSPLESTDTNTAHTPTDQSITIVATGDELAHNPINQSAKRYATGNGYDYRPMFADIKSLITAADLAICHLETPLSPDNSDLSVPNILVFNTPHELADALAASGYDSCDFASNHTMDKGLTGLEDTESVVRNAGMGYAGPTAHQDKSGKAEILKAGDTKVAHLGFTYTFPNNWGPNTDIPTEAPWLKDSSWPTQGPSGIIAQAQAAKNSGADFVVVSLHWGAEYQQETTTDQRKLAKELLESEAVDLILGTHAHIVQPCEIINDKHVIYGMGNSLSNQSPQTASGLKPETQDGMVARFTLTRTTSGKTRTQMEYQPTHVDLQGHVIRQATSTSYPESRARTISAVNALGGCNATPLGN